MQSKIRDAQLELIPYMAVVGDKEAAEGSVALRDRIDGDLGMMPVDQAVARLREEIDGRQVRQVVKSEFKGFEGETAADNEYQSGGGTRVAGHLQQISTPASSSLPHRGHVHAAPVVSFDGSLAINSRARCRSLSATCSLTPPRAVPTWKSCPAVSSSCIHERMPAWSSRPRTIDASVIDG